MTVKELIEKLQNLNPDLPVEYTESCWYIEVDDVYETFNLYNNRAIVRID